MIQESLVFLDFNLSFGIPSLTTPARCPLSFHSFFQNWLNKAMDNLHMLLRFIFPEFCKRPRISPKRTYCRYNLSFGEGASETVSKVWSGRGGFREGRRGRIRKANGERAYVCAEEKVG